MVLLSSQWLQKSFAESCIHKTQLIRSLQSRNGSVLTITFQNIPRTYQGYKHTIKLGGICTRNLRARQNFKTFLLGSRKSVVLHNEVMKRISVILPKQTSEYLNCFIQNFIWRSKRQYCLVI